MWNSMLSCFYSRSSSDEVVELRKPNSDSNTIYRDELDNKPSTTKKSSDKQRRVRFADDSKTLMFPTEDAQEFEKKEVIRVKVKMTREEAARMLSKCKDGGLLEFHDVARELVQLPINRISTTVACSITTSPPPVLLKSIPEEF